MADYAPQNRMSLWYLADPAAPMKVGTLDLVDRGRGVSLLYGDAWLQGGFALSEDLPLIRNVFSPSAPETAAGAVDDARPDRWGERVIRVLDKPPRLSLLEYLYFAGDDRFGALGVSLEDDRYAPRAPSALPMIGDVARVYEVAMKVAAGEPVDERERRLLAPGRSFGGAKPKSLVTIDGDQWVLKFSDEYDLDWPTIEHAVMRLAARCGITVCETRAIPFAHRRSAVAVRRFDRLNHASRAAQAVPHARLHCVSAGVALRAAGEQLGYPELAAIFRRLMPAGSVAESGRELYRRMVFNILVDNTDDHEKNHVLVRGAGGHALSPAFDVVPALQNLGYQAMRVGAADVESTLDNALSQAPVFGFSRDEAAEAVAAICRVVADWRQHLAVDGVADRDIQALEPYLDGEKARMRQELLGRPQKPAAAGGRSLRRR